MKKIKLLLVIYLLAVTQLTAKTSESIDPTFFTIDKEESTKELSSNSIAKLSPFKLECLPYSVSTQQELPGELYIAIYIHNGKLYLNLGGANEEKRLGVIEFIMELLDLDYLSEKAEKQFLRSGWICCPFSELNASLEAIADGKSIDGMSGIDISLDQREYRLLFNAVKEISVKDIANKLYVANYNRTHDKKISTISEIPEDEDIEEINFEELFVTEPYKMPDYLPYHAILITDGTEKFDNIKSVLKFLSYADFFRIELLTSEINFYISEQPYSQDYHLVDPTIYAFTPIGNFYPLEHIDYTPIDIYAYENGLIPITLQLTGEQSNLSFHGNSYCAITNDSDKSLMPIFDVPNSKIKSLTSYLHEIRKKAPVLIEIDSSPEASYADFVTLISSLRLVGIDKYLFKIPE